MTILTFFFIMVYSQVQLKYAAIDILNEKSQLYITCFTTQVKSTLVKALTNRTLLIQCLNM